MLGVSILTFRGRAIADVVVEAVSPMLRSGSSAEQLPGFPEPSLATIWLPILMLYMPVGAGGSAHAAHRRHNPAIQTDCGSGCTR